MITAIQHIFSAFEKKDNKVSYTMKVELAKDALEDIVTNRTSRKEDWLCLVISYGGKVS